MALAFKKYYTEDDYYSLPENIRAELIDGKLIYNQAAPSRLHQALLMELAGTIRDSCEIQQRFLPRLPRPLCRQAGGGTGHDRGTGYPCDL